MTQRLAVVLGSAFEALPRELVPEEVQTRAGPVVFHRDVASGNLVFFRHGAPHHRLPNQIPYRAFGWGLKALGVGSLLVTSSVGVLDPEVPLFQPLLVKDLVWLDNRLPDGSAATLFDTPMPEQGHLVVEHGLFSSALGEQLRGLATTRGIEIPESEVVFWYAPGPRTKTAAENRVLRGMGLQVNSMTLAPEVVLANEAGVSTAAVVVGHKASGDTSRVLGTAGIRGSLVDARAAVERLVLAFLDHGRVVPNPNPLYRFD